jgi:Glycerophosphoryl diester phosphodiesterase family
LLTENTLPAFANAISMGVDAPELDLGATKDDVLVARECGARTRQQRPDRPRVARADLEPAIRSSIAATRIIMPSSSLLDLQCSDQRILGLHGNARRLSCDLCADHVANNHGTSPRQEMQAGRKAAGIPNAMANQPDPIAFQDRQPNPLLVYASSGCRPLCGGRLDVLV